jgi:hypothetical protein
MFGKTRLGKSNVVKLLAQGILEATNQLQLAVDTLKLTGEAYHLPLRDQSGKVVGFAQFKRVPDRKTPVLATVLGPKMKPRGVDVEPKLVWAGQKKS